MEFQVNLMLAAFVAMVGALLGLAPELAGPGWRAAAEWAAFSFVTLGGLSWFLLRAARKNYHRHIAKMMSLMGAAICGKPGSRNDVATGPRP